MTRSRLRNPEENHSESMPFSTPFISWKGEVCWPSKEKSPSPPPRGCQHRELNTETWERKKPPQGDAPRALSEEALLNSELATRNLALYLDFTTLIRKVPGWEPAI